MAQKVASKSTRNHKLSEFASKNLKNFFDEIFNTLKRISKLNQCRNIYFCCMLIKREAHYHCNILRQKMRGNLNSFDQIKRLRTLGLSLMTVKSDKLVLPLAENMIESFENRVGVTIANRPKTVGTFGNKLFLTMFFFQTPIKQKGIVTQTENIFKSPACDLPRLNSGKW